MKQDIYSKVTNQIIEQLENGSAPWLKPWQSSGTAATASMPHNAATGRAYSGINVMLLWAAPYATHGWLTYKQATALGGNVQRGQKGTHIVFWSQFEKKNASTDKMERFGFFKGYTVFNVDQCEGLTTAKLYDAPTSFDTTDTDAIHLASANGATLQHGGDRAFFSPHHDLIQMPVQDAFDHINGYDATLLHELTHWSGSEKRLDRTLTGRFGDDAYAFEELIAEIGSAFLCVQLGVTLAGLQHANYLATWLRVLKTDKRAIFTAASKAKQASEFLLTPLSDTVAVAA